MSSRGSAETGSTTAPDHEPSPIRSTVTSVSRIAVTAGLAIAIAFPNASSAHRDVTVTLCIPERMGGSCAKGGGSPAYLYGDSIVIKGRTDPQHPGTVKIQRRKGRGDWRVVAEDDLEEGRYRYLWQTRRRDADQDTPYKFRVRLPDHDTSRVQTVYVVFGE